VEFARYLDTVPGEVVRVCGAPNWLGGWDVALGLQCTCVVDDVGCRWEASASTDLEVGQFDYKYIRVLGDGSSRWEQGPNRSVEVASNHSSATVHKGDALQKLAINDTSITVRFKVHYEVAFGMGVGVCGSPTELGSWNVSDALRLQWHENHVWEADVSIPSRFLETAFTYKFVILPNNDATLEGISGGLGKSEAADWEPGPHRTAQLDWLEVASADEVREIWGAWGDCTLVKMSIFYPTRPGERMAVCGGHGQLGDWQNPRPMALGREQLLRTGVRGVSWEVTFPMPQACAMQYRYVVLPAEGTDGSAVWEREPNRVAHFPGSRASVPDGILEVRDVNFVGGMQFDFVPPCLFVGPYPQTPEHIDRLIEAGVGGVLNTQTTEDFHRRQIDGKVLWDHYYHKQVDARHFPIEDFNGDDLARKLIAGAGQVHDMVCQGKKVFIHCTAGMGRAPAVAVVYLCQYHGYSFEHALSHVKAHRTVAAPNVGAMRRALGL